MCCLFALLLIVGPRFTAIAWWLFDGARWGQVFGSLLVPLLGVVFAPWTTLAWVLVSPGGVRGIDWFFLGLALLIDAGSYAGGASRGRWERARD
jgi:hypothetical protein